MSIATAIKRLFFVEERQAATLQNPPEWLYSLLGGSKTAAGVSINSETALAHAAVFACSKVLSESVASLPLELFLSTGQETKALTTDAR